MYQQGYTENLVRVGLAEKSRTILFEDLSLSEYEPVVAEEAVNFRFLAGTMVWLDIISSITAGTAPHLLPHQFSVFASNSQTKLEDIMGCKNWVMLQIGRIAALHEYKTQALQQGRFDCTEFEQTVGDITREIQCDLTQGVLEGSDPSTLVTHFCLYGISMLSLGRSWLSKAGSIRHNHFWSHENASNSDFNTSSISLGVSAVCYWVCCKARR